MMDGRTGGHGQTYIPPPSAGDKKKKKESQTHKTVPETFQYLSYPCYPLTFFSPADFSILIVWMSPFQVLVVSSGCCHSHSNFHKE